MLVFGFREDIGYFLDKKFSCPTATHHRMIAKKTAECTVMDYLIAGSIIIEGFKKNC